MQVSPVRQYRAPSYPTRGDVDTDPTLLTALPRRWQGNTRVLTALAITCGIALPPWQSARAKDAAPPPAVVAQDTSVQQTPETSETPSDEPQINLSRRPIILPSKAYNFTMGVTQGSREVIQPRYQFFVSTLTPSVITINDTLVAPLRWVADHLGATVTYKDGIATVQREKTTIVYHLNSTHAALNGTPLTLPLRVRLRDGQLRVPVRSLVEAFGGTVAWDAEDNTAAISSPGKAPLYLTPAGHFRAKAPRQTISRAEVEDFLAWAKSEGIV